MNDDVNLYDGLPKIDQGTVRVVNYIFDRLSGIIPSMHYSASSQVSMDSRKREYTYALMEAHITNMASINKAIEKIRKAGLNFLPSPSDFIKFCQPSPEDIGAPSLEDAYSEACLHAHPQSWTKDWSHPAVHHAYKMTGANSFVSVTTGKGAQLVMDKFEANYLQACLDYAAGKIMDQVEHKKESFEPEKNKIVYNEKDWKPGNILDKYKNVSSAEECFAVCEKILGKGASRLKNLVAGLEKKYKEQHGIG